MAKQAEVLRIEGPLGKKIHKALVGKRPLPDVVALLGSRVEKDRLPTWISYNGGETLDHVARLAPPRFVALGADEDEFFDEPGGPQLVLDKNGSGSRVSEQGKTTFVRITSALAGKVTAYDGGGFLLRDLTWLAEPPTLAQMKRLLAEAMAAYSGDLPPYETSRPVEAPPIAPVAAPGTGGCFMGSSQRRGVVEAKVSRKRPKVAWFSRFQDNDGDEHGGSPVLADGAVIAGGSGFSAKLSATDLNGKTLWKKELSKSQSWSTGNVCVDRGVVYHPTNKALHALDAKTGKLRWTANLSTVEGSPVVVGDQVFVGTGEGLVGLSVANGRRQWTFKVKRDDVKLGVAGGVAFADGVFYFVAENQLFAVELSGGKARWSSGPACARNTPSLDEHTVYTWHEADLVAFDRADGKQRWRKKFEKFHNYNTVVAVADDRVVAHADGALFALRKTNGAELWRVSSGDDMMIGSASPVIAGDVVLCVLYPTLRAVALASGKVLWKLDAFADRASLSYNCTPVVAPDGTIIVQAYGLQALR